MQFTGEPSYTFCKRMCDKLNAMLRNAAGVLTTMGEIKVGVETKVQWKMCSSEADVNLCSVRCEDVTFASKTLEERTSAILCIPL